MYRMDMLAGEEGEDDGWSRPEGSLEFMVRSYGGLRPKSSM